VFNFASLAAVTLALEALALGFFNTAAIFRTMLAT
jgi:hypothetical protein